MLQAFIEPALECLNVPEGMHLVTRTLSVTEDIGKGHLRISKAFLMKLRASTRKKTQKDVCTAQQRH